MIDQPDGVQAASSGSRPSTLDSRPSPLVPERIDAFDGDQPVEGTVSAFLARLIPAPEEGANTPAGALVPWVCDVLLSEHSVRGYGRDSAHFAKHMRELGVPVQPVRTGEVPERGVSSQRDSTARVPESAAAGRTAPEGDRQLTRFNDLYRGTDSAVFTTDPHFALIAGLKRFSHDT